MAKKAVKTRVHHLAKKIGVESKDIVAKCKSEGIPGITTYQSAISAGLQATIVEWFSEVEDKASSSAIETAAKVDVTAESIPPEIPITKPFVLELSI